MIILTFLEEVFLFKGCRNTTREDIWAKCMTISIYDALSIGGLSKLRSLFLSKCSSSQLMKFGSKLMGIQSLNLQFDKTELKRKLPPKPYYKYSNLRWRRKSELPFWVLQMSSKTFTPSCSMRLTLFLFQKLFILNTFAITMNITPK